MIKMNKKIITIVFALLFSINGVNAELFSTITSTGLSFVNPAASAVLNGILCVTGPTGLITCATNYAQGKITGIIQGEAITKIAQSGALGQKIVNSISTYNQVKGYLDEGAKIIRELKIDENGKLIDGSISNSKINGEYVGNLFGLDKEDIFIEGEIKIDLNQKSEVTKKQENHISFLKGAGKLWIKDKNTGKLYFYENIDSSRENLFKIDKNGDLIEAVFSVGKNGGSYSFPTVDKELKLPDGARVYYSNGELSINLDSSSNPIYYDNLVINKRIKYDILFNGDVIGCYGCKINDMILYGSIQKKEEGFLLMPNSELEREKILFQANGKLFIANQDADTSIYPNWVKVLDKDLIAHNQDHYIILEFLDGNKFFDLDNTGLKNTERKTIMIGLFGNNDLKITNRNAENKVPLITHDGSKNSEVRIDTGIFSFNIKKDDFRYSYDPINKKNLKQTQFSFASNNLNKFPNEDFVLMTKEEKTFVVHDRFKKENAVFFDGSRLKEEPKNLIYNKESIIGDRITRFADDKVGDSAFVWGGRGNIYYDESDPSKSKKCNIPVKGALGFDCIGLANSALSEVYKKPLSEFPSDIRIVKKLKEYGWESYVIEPRSAAEDDDVAEDDKTKAEVEKIPSGSIAFLMHIGDDKECNPKFNCIEYKGKKIIMGHTLIKRNDVNFINANPGQEELMPRYAIEYNRKAEEEGKSPVFDGIIRRGDLIPTHDYLLVITPPKNKK